MGLNILFWKSCREKFDQIWACSCFRMSLNLIMLALSDASLEGCLLSDVAWTCIVGFWHETAEDVTVLEGFNPFSLSMYFVVWHWITLGSIVLGSDFLAWWIDPSNSFKLHTESDQWHHLCVHNISWAGRRPHHELTPSPIHHHNLDTHICNWLKRHCICLLSTSLISIAGCCINANTSNVSGPAGGTHSSRAIRHYGLLLSDCGIHLIILYLRTHFCVV